MFQIGWIFEHSDLVGRLENTLFLMHFKLLSQNQRVGGKRYRSLLVLFNVDRCAHIFEALVGTLSAAKKRKVLSYEGELLLQGVHDNVKIILKPAPLPASGTATASVVKNVKN
uniref:Costars domain-containing protein n=1 Tax=Populus trichocarpa TaxID=3694 RepID=A0A3N7G7E1_POPTR